MLLSGCGQWYACGRDWVARPSEQEQNISTRDHKGTLTLLIENIAIVFDGSHRQAADTNVQLALAPDHTWRACNYLSFFGPSTIVRMHQRFLSSLGGSFALVVALFAALVVGCARDSTVRDLGTRAVVIGVDGADWKIIDALVAEGELPNFEHLRRQGVWGKIATLTDIPLSPVIWTSVATGKTAAKHGVAWFMVDRPDGTRVPVRSYNRKTKAIWNILAEQGRKPVVVGWWATYPAEDVNEGAIVSDGLGFHGFGSTARDGEDSRKTYPSALFAPAGRPHARRERDPGRLRPPLPPPHRRGVSR